MVFVSADRPADINAIFDLQVAGAPVDFDEGDCEVFNNAISGYLTEQNLFGRVACYRDGGSSFLTWTIDELRVFAFAQEESRFDLDLFDWWTELFEVLPTVVEPPPILPHVPATFRDTCEESVGPLFGAELVSVTCEPPSDAPADLAAYALFDSVDQMQSAFDNELEVNGIERDSGGGCPGEGPWTERGEDIGRLGCGFLDDDVLMIWTEPRIPMIAFALDLDADRDDAELREWWRADAGGPIP